MTLVTVAALYGAGGSRVAPALAQRLDVPFLGRPHLPHPEECGDEAPRLSKLASMAVAWGTPPGLSVEDLLPDEAKRREFEREAQALAETGRGVILGRAGVALLREHPRVLHVLLDGPKAARVEQAMAIEDISRAEAERRLNRADRFRRAYLQDLYGIDPREPGVFHMTLDSTALSLDDCVDLIARAAGTRAAPR
ncbi:cytidylate kinase-like family protein [Solirubrobacter taibaiensis]|nr:cytidylate kinase-like family protein [Solirubrobacter taibaiensis]